MVKLIIFIVTCLKLVHSQYYGQPNTYPYYFQPPTPMTSSYAPSLTPGYPYPPQPISPYPYASTVTPTSYPQAFGLIPPPPAYPTPYTTYAPFPVPFNPYPPVTSKAPTSNTQIGLPTPKSPMTATAYYITAPETPKAVLVDKVKENLKELPAPSYPCPFCTGFANVPKNPKVPPPPPCSSVLPGILDKIPTLSLPDELKIKKLDKFAKPCPLLADLFENKLSGKLKFDEDLLDGFLTGLGLGK